MSRVVDLAMASLNERAFAEAAPEPGTERPVLQWPRDEAGNPVARDIVASVLGRDTREGPPPLPGTRR